ncbi:MAG: PTS sugar transporter subunit IIA [Phycisphaeraceae bacterium]
MRLTEILSPDSVKVPLTATTKQEAIFELVDQLVQVMGLEKSRDELRNNVWQREQTRSTGIGHNVAIPHGKCKVLSRLAMAVGKTAAPMEFGSIDGKPVEIIFLLASPMDQNGPHIQALASISRMLTDPVMRNSIRAAQSAEELYEVITQYEAKVAT